MSNYKRLKELTILYVEDNIDIQEELFEIIKLKVGKVYVASNGKEGLDIFNQHSLDLIITDIKMPIMDGLTMTEHIRQKNEEIPIIVTTAFNEPTFLKKQ